MIKSLAPDNEYNLFVDVSDLSFYLIQNIKYSLMWTMIVLVMLLFLTHTFLFLLLQNDKIKTLYIFSRWSEIFNKILIIYIVYVRKGLFVDMYIIGRIKFYCSYFIMQYIRYRSTRCFVEIAGSCQLAYTYGKQGVKMAFH